MSTGSWLEAVVLALALSGLFVYAAGEQLLHAAGLV